MMVAMSCVTSAPHHKDITPHISPPFASIPELQAEGTLNSTDLSCPVVSGNTADLGTIIPTDSSNVASISCSVNSSNAADKNIFISANSSNVASIPRLVNSGNAANKNISGNPATPNY